MKKLILFLYILVFFSGGNSFAWGVWDPNSPDFVWPPAPTSSPQNETSWWDGKIKVRVTEKIPGLNCELVTEWTWTGMYDCKIEPGFKSVQGIMGNIIRWITAIAALSWVLFIVINGIMLSTGSESGEVKKRIVQWIIWLILVLLSWIILNMIAPWVYK